MTLSGALRSAGLTTLRLCTSAAGLELTLRRDWDPHTDFSRYSREFQLDQVPCRQPRALGDAEARALLADQGATADLDRLEGWMRAGRHEMLVLFVHAGLGIELCHFIHSSRQGRNNGLHALRAGGIRRHGSGAVEHRVLRDGLNLARAMSFKCAAAAMPFGVARPR